MGVAAEQVFSDPVLERGDADVRARALRKNTWRMMPILILAFIINYIDRSSISFAGLTMNKDLGLTATQFGWAAGILSVSYGLFEIPSNLALHRFGARRWLARIMITWGIAAAVTALVVGPYSLYAARLLLGAAEAGFFPGVAYLLGLWFPRQYRAQVLCWLSASVPFSFVVGGPISVLLLRLEGILGLHGWQWMFIMEGIPACIVGFCVLYILRDSPSDAHWLTDAERQALTGMLADERRDRAAHTFVGALKDKRVWILAAIQTGFIIGAFGLGAWLPLILKESDLTNLEIGFVSAAPYLVAVAVMPLWGRVVDRTGWTIESLAIACLLGAVGMIGSVLLTNSFLLSLIGFGIAVVGVSCARGIFWAIPSRFLVGAAAAGGLAFINSVATVGGFLGPIMMGWMRDATGSFSAGIIAMSGFCILAMLLSLSLKLVIREQ